MIIIIILFLIFFLFVLIKTKQTCGCVFILLYRVCLFVIIYSHLYYYFPPLPSPLLCFTEAISMGKTPLKRFKLAMSLQVLISLPFCLLSLFSLYISFVQLYSFLSPLSLSLSLSLSLLKLYFNVLIIMMMIIIISGASERMVAVSYRHKWFDSQLFLYRHNLSNVSLSLFFFLLLLIIIIFVCLLCRRGGNF